VANAPRTKGWRPNCVAFTARLEHGEVCRWSIPLLNVLLDPTCVAWLLFRSCIRHIDFFTDILTICDMNLVTLCYILQDAVIWWLVFRLNLF